MMLSEERRKRLSKFLSLLLRHRPEKFGLRLDEHGFAPLEELLAVVRREREWEQVTEEQIREVVANSDKQRFEIAGSNIRARYGHSAPQRITYPEAEPPEILYHGTSPQSLPAIRTEGLRPMRRQYVHLSTSTEQAREVGRRHSREPVLLTVRARAAWRAGVKFYQPEDRLYLSAAIPAVFIEEAKENDPSQERAIRKAQPADIPQMVDLSEQKRIQYQSYQPTFWRKAAAAREKQIPHFERVVSSDRVIALVHESAGSIDGFVIAALVEAPPVYDPGGLTSVIDDFVVADGRDWATTGLALLTEANREAKARGAVQTVVVCGHQDQPKRAMLAAGGFSLASEWYVREVV